MTYEIRIYHEGTVIRYEDNVVRTPSTIYTDESKTVQEIVSSLKSQGITNYEILPEGSWPAPSSLKHMSNVFIGSNAGIHETAHNRLYIDNTDTSDPLIYGEFDNNFVKINGDLQVTGDINFTGSLPGFSIVDTDYDTLLSMYENDELVPGQEYRFTYRMRNVLSSRWDSGWIHHEIWTGPDEVIVVKAVDGAIPGPRVPGPENILDPNLDNPDIWQVVQFGESSGVVSGGAFSFIKNGNDALAIAPKNIWQNLYDNRVYPGGVDVEIDFDSIEGPVNFTFVSEGSNSFTGEVTSNGTYSFSITNVSTSSTNPDYSIYINSGSGQINRISVIQRQGAEGTPIPKVVIQPEARSETHPNDSIWYSIHNDFWNNNHINGTQISDRGNVYWRIDHENVIDVQWDFRGFGQRIFETTPGSGLYDSWYDNQSGVNYKDLLTLKDDPKSSVAQVLLRPHREIDNWRDGEIISKWALPNVILQGDIYKFETRWGNDDIIVCKGISDSRIGSCAGHAFRENVREYFSSESTYGNFYGVVANVQNYTSVTSYGDLHDCTILSSYEGGDIPAGVHRHRVFGLEPKNVTYDELLDSYNNDTLVAGQEYRFTYRMKNLLGARYSEGSWITNEIWTGPDEVIVVKAVDGYIPGPRVQGPENIIDYELNDPTAWLVEEYLDSTGVVSGGNYTFNRLSGNLYLIPNGVSALTDDRTYPGGSDIEIDFTSVGEGGVNFTFNLDGATSYTADVSAPGTQSFFLDYGTPYPSISYRLAINSGSGAISRISVKQRQGSEGVRIPKVVIQPEARSETYPQDSIWYSIDNSFWNNNSINGSPVSDRGNIFWRIDHEAVIDVQWDFRGYGQRIFETTPGSGLYDVFYDNQSGVSYKDVTTFVDNPKARRAQVVLRPHRNDDHWQYSIYTSLWSLPNVVIQDTAYKLESRWGNDQLMVCDAIQDSRIGSCSPHIFRGVTREYFSTESLGGNFYGDCVRVQNFRDITCYGSLQNCTILPDYVGSIPAGNHKDKVFSEEQKWTVVDNVSRLEEALARQDKNIYIKNGNYTLTNTITLYDNLHLKGEAVPSDGYNTNLDGVRLILNSDLFQAPLTTPYATGLAISGEVIPAREDRILYLNTNLTVDIPAGSIMVCDNGWVYDVIRPALIGQNAIYIQNNISVENFDEEVTVSFYPPNASHVLLERFMYSGNGDFIMDIKLTKHLTFRDVHIDEYCVGGWGKSEYNIDITLDRCSAHDDEDYNAYIFNSNGVKILNCYREGHSGPNTDVGRLQYIINGELRNCRGGNWKVFNSYNFEFDNCHLDGVAVNDDVITVSYGRYFSIINSSCNRFDVTYCDHFMITGCDSQNISNPITLTGSTNYKIFGNHWQSDIASGVVDITYANLTTLINSSDLIPGQQYRLTDYRMVHTSNLSGMSWTGDVEVLALRAISSDKLDSRAVSESYPDDIIEYTTNNAHFYNDVGPDRGVITYRKDPHYDIACDWDWRSSASKVRLWEDAPGSGYFYMDTPQVDCAYQDYDILSPGDMGMSEVEYNIHRDTPVMGTDPNPSYFPSALLRAREIYKVRVDWGADICIINNATTGWLDNVTIGSCCAIHICNHAEDPELHLVKWSLSNNNNLDAKSVGFENVSIMAQFRINNTKLLGCMVHPGWNPVWQLVTNIVEMKGFIFGPGSAVSRGAATGAELLEAQADLIDSNAWDETGVQPSSNTIFFNDDGLVTQPSPAIVPVIGAKYYGVFSFEWYSAGSMSVSFGGDSFTVDHMALYIIEFNPTTGGNLIFDNSTGDLIGRLYYLSLHRNLSAR